MQAASRRWLKAADYVCAGCVRRQKRAFHVGQRARQEQSILELLEERGYVNQIAGDRNTLSRLLSTRKIGFYAGIDPTAPSLHLGHLLPLMVLFWLYHHGHHVVSLVGGATARVGDPSGRLTSRAKTAENVHQVNFETMFAQVGKIWENAVRYGERHGYQQANLGEKELLNNASWLGGLNILDFLKLMGNGMRLGTMLGRDTVRNRMEKGDRMSFSEFTYPLLQGWDWWHMYQHHGIQVQIGGSDQYGNIISGMDGVKYIARTNAGEREKDWLDQGGRLKEDLQPMGLTVPLLTTASGEKFGKSAGNALWLDRSMTSSFDLYGFLLRSSDEDVARYLKLFTFIPLQQIAATMSEHAADPGKREAQHLLASEVLELVHGREEAIKTREEHRSLRNPSLAALAQQTNMSNGQAEQASSASQRTVLPASLVLTTPFSRILYHAGVAPTKSEGARMVAKGGIYVAKAESADESKLTFIQIRDQKPAEVSGFVMNGLLVLRIGKWKTRILEVVEDAVFDERKLEAPGWQEWKAVRPQR